MQVFLKLIEKLVGLENYDCFRENTFSLKIEIFLVLFLTHNRVIFLVNT